jgi:hypothetical protein
MFKNNQKKFASELDEHEEQAQSLQWMGFKLG